MPYLAASFALGGIATWASEWAFWTVMPAFGSPLEPLLLLLLYALASAAALSAAMWSGVRGWPAAFLGGCLLGYAVEGAVVGTTYDDLPVNLAWTALSWHGLVTGGVVLALLRAPWPAGRLALAWAGLGLGLAVWAQGWAEAGGPDLARPESWAWLGGTALLLPLSAWGLDRLGPIPRPRPLLLWAAPALLALAWAAQAALLLDPRRLLLVPLVALVLWVMRRRATAEPLAARLPNGGPARLLLPLLAPLVAALAAPVLQPAGAPLPWAQPVLAALLTLAALSLLLRLALRGSTRAVPAASGP